MSGIYIPDMEIPNSCFKGAFNNCPSYADCKALKRFCDNHSYTEIINTIYTGRLGDCPLVEVPPHGVLKDIDVLNDAIIEAVRLGEITGGEAGFFKAILTNAPIVIDASKH